MKTPDFKFPEQSFNDVPTKTQLVNLCRDLNKFLQVIAASLVINGDYAVNDPPCGGLFNAATQLKACADMFEAGPNSAGLAVPQPGPMAVRR